MTLRARINQIIISGLVIVVAVLLFSRAVSLAAMPAMAALLIIAGFQSIDRERFMDVWDVGWGPRIVMVVTLLTTLVMPIQYAVLVGVILSGFVFYHYLRLDDILRESTRQAMTAAQEWLKG